MTSPYDTLGVPPEASAEDVKAAYRREIRKAHPDKGGSQERAVAVNEAWRILAQMDPHPLPIDDLRRSARRWRPRGRWPVVGVAT